MQSVLNSAARLVFSASRYDHTTRFQPAALAEGAKADRVQELAVLIYRCLHQMARRMSLRYSTSRLMSRPVGVSSLLRHYPLLSATPVFQLSAIEIFPLLNYGTLPQNFTSVLFIFFSERLHGALPR